MDKLQATNSLETQTRRNTIDSNNTETSAPRYDFVLPSYSRDRRKSSITTTLPPETIVTDGTTNVNISIPEQDPSSSETANTQKGKRIIKLFYLIFRISIN